MPMTTSYNSPAPWEIWWAFVEYEDQQGIGKKRPVLVIPGNDSPLIMVLKMTSHSPRGNFKGEYQLIDYKSAGLKKPTVVRCSKIMSMDEKSFNDKIGILQPRDIMNITNILRDMY